MSDARRRVMIRLVGAPLLIAALAAILALDHWRQDHLGLRLLVLAMSLACLRELLAMQRGKGLRPWGLGAAVALVFAQLAYAPGLAGVLGRLGLDAGVASRIVSPVQAGLVPAFLVAVAARLVWKHGAFDPADAGATVLATGYLSLALFCIPEEHGATRPDVGPLWWLAFLFAVNKGSDMAAYATGKLVGRRKMAPVLSPHKTWEGAIGGLVVGAGAGAWILLGPLRERLHAADGALVALAVAATIAAQLGDLAESAVKRWAGVKDSGRLLPEFGGALDMMDSFLLSAPVAALGAAWIRG